MGHKVVPGVRLPTAFLGLVIHGVDGSYLAAAAPKELACLGVTMF